MHITCIIPTYNEAENLPQLVSALLVLPLNLRLLVVDDHSPDGSGEIADVLARKNPDKMSVLHREGKMGLRSAYLEGIRISLERGTDAIAQMDADGSHDPSVLPTMVEKLRSCDLVLGSRYVPGGRVDRDWPIWRKGLSAWGNFYARTLLGLPYRDVTTGYRLWRADILRQLPLHRVQTSGYIFLVEMVYLAHIKGLSLCETPIVFSERKRGKSKMSLQIQAEAAFSVWKLLWEYRDLRMDRGVRGKK